MNIWTPHPVIPEPSRDQIRSVAARMSLASASSAERVDATVAGATMPLDGRPLAFPPATVVVVVVDAVVMVVARVSIVARLGVVQNIGTAET